MGSEILRHLRWYLTSEPTPRGRLENDFGDLQSPLALAATLSSLQPKRVVRTSPAAAPNGEPSEIAEDEKKGTEHGLDMLIEYLAEEMRDKQLEKRAARWKEMKPKNCDGPEARELLKRLDCAGTEALDAYVSWIVAALRDFPYLAMPEGREAGIFIRDELIAKVFEDHWDFYNNKKRKGFDLDEFYEALRILLTWLRDTQKDLKE